MRSTGEDPVDFSSVALGFRESVSQVSEFRRRGETAPSLLEPVSCIPADWFRCRRVPIADVVLDSLEVEVKRL